MPITKAIIPVGGWGARRLPITKAIEKCMLPVGDRPIVDYVVQDCIAAGITEIYFVVSETSTQLRAYYSENEEYSAYLTAAGKQDLIELITPPKGLSLHYVVQPAQGKYGTAVPVSLVVPFLTPGESVAVLMGDDFIYSPQGNSELARLIGETPPGGNGMLGVTVPQAQISKYGVLELNDSNDFVRIVEKPSAKDAPSDLINVSKYVLNYDILTEIVSYTERARVGEYYVTDPINDYVRGGGSVKVVRAVGEYLDGGNVEGWLHANEVVLGHG